MKQGNNSGNSVKSLKQVLRFLRLPFIVSLYVLAVVLVAGGLSVIIYSINSNQNPFTMRAGEPLKVIVVDGQSKEQVTLYEERDLEVVASVLVEMRINNGKVRLIPYNLNQKAVELSDDRKSESVWTGETSDGYAVLTTTLAPGRYFAIFDAERALYQFTQIGDMPTEVRILLSEEAIEHQIFVNAISAFVQCLVYFLASVSFVIFIDRKISKYLKDFE